MESIDANGSAKVASDSSMTFTTDDIDSPAAIAQNELVKGMRTSRKFFVQKAIVWPRSDFVNAAVKNFREGVTGTIALEEADEIVVEKLVEYLYTLDYDDGRDFGLSTGPLDEHDLGNLFQLPVKSPTYMNALHLAINLGVAADRFFARALNDLALLKFQSAVDHATHHYSVDQAMEVIMSVYGNIIPDD